MAVELRNTIKEKMEKGEVAYTLSVKTVRTVEISMMAKTAGFDGILIDMEHSSFDLYVICDLLSSGWQAFFSCPAKGTHQDTNVINTTVTPPARSAYLPCTLALHPSSVPPARTPFMFPAFSTAELSA